MGKIKQSLDAIDTRCAYQKIYDEIDDEDRRAITDAIGNEKGAYIIANALRDGGYTIAHSTVGMHLGGRCKCP